MLDKERGVEGVNQIVEARKQGYRIYQKSGSPEGEGKGLLLLNGEEKSIVLYSSIHPKKQRVILQYLYRRCEEAIERGETFYMYEYKEHRKKRSSYLDKVLEELMPSKGLKAKLKRVESNKCSLRVGIEEISREYGIAETYVCSRVQRLIEEENEKEQEYEREESPRRYRIVREIQNEGIVIKQSEGIVGEEKGVLLVGLSCYEKYKKSKVIFLDGNLTQEEKREVLCMLLYKYKTEYNAETDYNYQYKVEKYMEEDKKQREYVREKLMPKERIKEDLEREEGSLVDKCVTLAEKYEVPVKLMREQIEEIKKRSEI